MFRRSVAAARRVLTATPLLAIAPAVAASQPRATGPSIVADSTVRQLLRTRDGSTLVGRVCSVSGDTVHFETAGGTLRLLRTDIREARKIRESAIRNGEYWPENPHDSRLFFAPTGRTLEQGEGYFADAYLFFLNTSVGVTSRFTMGGGFSVFPFDDFGDNVFYLTPKVGLVKSEKVNVAAGALIGYAGGLLDQDQSLGILYGVGSVGSPDASINLGIGWGYRGSSLSDEPIIMAGFEQRLGRRVSFLSENYVIPGAGDLDNLVSYGLRFFGENLSVDLAFWNSLGEDGVFPGIPYVAFAVKF